MESIRIVMYCVYLFILKNYKLRTIVNVHFTELTNILKCITIKLFNISVILAVIG